jgi:hypothetical protein
VKAFPCPRCGRPLPPAGVVNVDGAEFPVYQCGECLSAVEVLGERFESALTFAVDAQGRPFDPAAERPGGGP